MLQPAGSAFISGACSFLFETAARTVVDDERGVITLPSECDFDVGCGCMVRGAARRRRMAQRAPHDVHREVDVPRLVASYALDDPVIPGELRAAARVAQQLAGREFNSAGLNFYRDERDSVAAHNDKLHELAAGAPIALLSLGATRAMTIRTKAAPRRSIQLELEPGSVLLMTYATQQHFDHGIPKAAVPVGPRISVAFRRRPRTAWRRR